MKKWYTVYHKYCDNDEKYHVSIVINYNEDAINLIESSKDSNIRIWDFHTGILLNKIKASDERLYGICLWDKNYLFVGCYDGIIKIIDIKNKKIIKSLKGHNKSVLSLKIINHPHYGECLISQGYAEVNIKLWLIKH